MKTYFGKVENRKRAAAVYGVRKPPVKPVASRYLSELGAQHHLSIVSASITATLILMQYFIGEAVAAMVAPSISWIDHRERLSIFYA